MNPIANKRFTFQGCSQHPRYKGSWLNIEVTWPISPPGGYHFPTNGLEQPCGYLFPSFSPQPMELLTGNSQFSMGSNPISGLSSPFDINDDQKCWTSYDVSVGLGSDGTPLRQSHCEKSGVNADCQPETWTKIYIYIVYIYIIVYI